MRRWLLAAAAALVLSNGALASPPIQEVESAGYRTPDGARATRHRVVVPASQAEVWAAFTTSEGFKGWGAPVAAVDLRIGGIIEATYRLDGRIGAPGNIQNQITAFVPGRLLAFRNVAAPPDAPFDAAAFQSIQTLVELEPLGPRETRVTLTGVGYGEGAAYDGVYKHFDWGNAWSLGQLRKSFVDGPTDWPKAFGEMARQSPQGRTR